MQLWGFSRSSSSRSLRELNLDRNGISAVPYLHQAESRQFFLHPALDGNSFRAEWYKSLSSLWQQPRPPPQEDMEVPAELEAKKGQLEHVVLCDNRDAGRMGEQHLPLPARAGSGECLFGCETLGYVTGVCSVCTSRHLTWFGQKCPFSLSWFAPKDPFHADWEENWQK